ncbi:hypothetical protein [Lacticaseibacillus daqingensis]|uniref:hypothetical protein n=1 Tax=Lacticaseibacillus daqingensis TaxID=2486014 RepID=UPI000F79960F|nr:hypothetical protein [Lacticaseibacillus daqingensis]
MQRWLKGLGVIGLGLLLSGWGQTQRVAAATQPHPRTAVALAATDADQLEQQALLGWLALGGLAVGAAAFTASRRKSR